MWNNYASVHATWADTTNMDNLRGADATGLATPGAMEVSSTADGVTGFGNTRHTYSGDEIHTPKCTTTLSAVDGWWWGEGWSWLWIGSGGEVVQYNWPTVWGSVVGYLSMTGTCESFLFKANAVGVSPLNVDGTCVLEQTKDGTTLTCTTADGSSSFTWNYDD